jgi:two-component system, sensor histidine kinase
MSKPFRPKVLYIEDNYSNRMLVKRVLEAEGKFQYLEAEDGVSGIAAAQQALPDIIIIDINIPGMDGYEVTTRLKSLESLRDTPVVALTAKTMRGDRERALSAGCDGYIQKPINVETFPLELNEFLRGKKEILGVVEESHYLREHSQRFAERLEEKIAELTRVNESLRETDRLKSRFIALAAHELRTPLTVIQGYVGILHSALSGGGVVDKQAALGMVGGIDKGVRRLSGIVSNMLDVTRLEAGTMQLNVSYVTVGDVVEAAVNDLQHALQERGHQLTVSDLDGLPRIWADNQRLYQVFVNIINNAIKYTPDGGRIHISGRFAPVVGSRTPHPRVTDLTTDYVDLVVQDNGIGITTKDQERIFQRFYEVRDDALHSTGTHSFQGGGVGLGLAIARGIVEAHGGWLWVESEGQDMDRCPGSQFHVLLPVRSPRKTPAQSGGEDRSS